MKRILLFVATNLAIMVTLSIVLTLLGIGGYRLPGGGLDYGALMVFCLVWGMGGAFISLALSRFMAKRAMGVQLVDGRTGREELDWVHGTVRQLTERAGLPMPEVGVYESPEVNAFATGPSKNRSLVAVSTGLLRAMRRDEVEGVLAHEVAHIANGDMVTMTLIQGVVNAFVMFFARIIANVARNAVDEKVSHLVGIVTTIALDIAFGMIGMMIVAWFSRAREFRADAGAGTLAGKGKMIAALQRLQQNTQMVDTSTPSLATMKISGARGMMALLSTHPPLEQRIAALQSGRP
jgi:heat shock protein HtpX